MKIVDEDLPEGYNTVNFFIIVKGGATNFIEFVEKVFGGIEDRQARTPDKDGLLIHAEIRVGDSTIMVADSKPDWPFTPAFPQVYVKDSQAVLDRAEQEGAKVLTEVSDFYYGMKLARFKDSWGNIWWLFERGVTPEKTDVEVEADVSWHDKKPSRVYTTLMEAMRDLGSRES
jgi:PhnB protein